MIACDTRVSALDCTGHVRHREREERSRDIWKEGCVCVLGPCATLGVSGSCG